MVETVKIPSYKEFFFCNLYFQLKSLSFLMHYRLTANDAYVFKQSIDKEINL